MDRRAHRAVEDEHALARGLRGRSASWRARAGCDAVATSVMKCGGCGSRAARWMRDALEAGLGEQLARASASVKPRCTCWSCSRTHSSVCARRSITSSRPPGTRMRRASASARARLVRVVQRLAQHDDVVASVGQRQVLDLALDRLDVRRCPRFAARARAARSISRADVDRGDELARPRTASASAARRRCRGPRSVRAARAAAARARDLPTCARAGAARRSSPPRGRSRRALRRAAPIAQRLEPGEVGLELGARLVLRQHARPTAPPPARAAIA